MFFRSDLLRALGVVALLMPAAIADGNAENLTVLASAPAEPQTPPIGSRGRVLPVFFEPHSAVLTPEAQRVLASLAARLEDSPERQLTVSGHAEADETGQTGLAARRAHAVRNFLAAQGIAGNRIAQAPAAETDIPLVRVLADTPLERRAEIAYR